MAITGDGTTGTGVILISTGIGTDMDTRVFTATGTTIPPTGLTRSTEEDFTTGPIGAGTLAFRPVTVAALSLSASTNRTHTAIARAHEA
jgi:hypothetical protein